MSETRWTTRANAEAADVAILLPGSGYTVQAPLLYWCAELLAEAGWQTRTASWLLDDTVDDDPQAFVESAVEAGFDGAVGRRLIVAKSFGTFALPWARRHDVAGVWLTPLCTVDEIATSLQDATERDLAAGGDADPQWQPGRLSGTRAAIHTVEGGDHALRVPLGWRASLDAQRLVLDAVAAHLGRRRAG